MTNLKCQVPFTGITIDSLGNLVVCCASDRFPIKHISEVDNLSTFFNSEIYEKIRKPFTDGTFLSLENCLHCSRAIKTGGLGFIQTYNNFGFSVKNKEQFKLQYLEVTTSNICNQACVMCGGKYSSKWIPYEKEAAKYNLNFRTETFRHSTNISKLNTDDINKILKILPEISVLVIKGGEPFSDQNNMVLLEELAKVNPKCTVHIVTNFSILSERILKTIHKFEDISIIASIDGFGDVYEWIRTTTWEQILKNIFRYNEYGGRKIAVSLTMSIFNWWHYKDMAEYFQEVPGVNRMTFSCLVEGPAYCSPLYLSPKHVEEGKQVFLTFLQENYSKQENVLSDHTGETWQHKKNKNFRIHRVENLLAVESVKETLPKKYHSQRKHIIPWLQFCNNFRNVDFDIRDIVPELNDIEKEINDVI